MGDERRLERFWLKVAITPSCWLWLPSENTGGYGSFWDGSRVVRAHRFSYELHVGPIPPRIVVRHKCDNPPCVNPGHLELGTQSDNILDASERGRHTQSRKTHCAKGHEYTKENTYQRLDKKGRECRACGLQRTKKYQQTRKGSNQ